MADALRLHRWLRAGIGTLALLAICFHACAVVVRQGQAVLITRFGRPIRTDTGAGLHFKMPWPIDEAIFLDMRSRAYEGGHTEMLTRDKKNIIVRQFITWHIADPLVFVQSVGSLADAVADAEEKLDGLFTNAAISTLGGHYLSALVSTDAANLAVDKIESELLAATAPAALRSYGIEVEQIHIERLALPEDNVKAVFEQMRAERRQYAAKYRAEGDQEASRIQSQADLEAAQIRAHGIEEQARIRGEAEAEAAKIYAEAHRTDPDLYHFTRSLESLNKLITPSTSIVLGTNVEPFSLLESKDK